MKKVQTYKIKETKKNIKTSNQTILLIFLFIVIVIGLIFKFILYNESKEEATIEYEDLEKELEVQGNIIFSSNSTNQLLEGAVIKSLKFLPLAIILGMLFPLVVRLTIHKD